MQSNTILQINKRVKNKWWKMVGVERLELPDPLGVNEMLYQLS